MNILVVNDDGINSRGIEKLAEAAGKFGKVTVVAPVSQCSAMSQKLTIYKAMRVAKADFPVKGVAAYSVDGTPADCIKIGINIIKEERPDIVFSGVNNGCNIGYDIAYSGTVGACFEALQQGIPAIAFSKPFGEDYEVVDRYLEEVITQILKGSITKLVGFRVPDIVPSAHVK